MLTAQAQLQGNMAAPLSAYETQRLANMAENRAKLISLGVETDIALLRTKARRPAVKGSAINKKTKDELVPPRSRSLRLQNRDVDGAALPDKPVLPPPAQVQRVVRKPSVPLGAAKVSTGATSSEEATAFLARLGRVLVSSATKKKKGDLEAASGTLDLGTLSVDEEDIAKLVPERIFSVEVHPSASKLLVAAGDTWGRVGLWDVDAGEESPVVTFEPHSRPVAGIRVVPHATHLLLSCSHDGVVRCLDLGKGQSGADMSFLTAYRAPEDAEGDYPMLHGFSRSAGEGGTLAIARSDGAAVLLDARTPSAAAAVVALHEKKIFSVDFSPARPHLLASASLDRTVCLWDVRAFGEKKPKPMATLDHGLSVTSVRFSSGGSRLLTACNDNLLRVFNADGESHKAWSLCSTVRHNNKTGRYLTSFQAEWLRGSDDVVLCGSLEQPRGIDVFRADDGSALERLEHEHVTSVVSLVAQHPTTNLLVGSNSGGKCFVWR
mmetsp:Transcript_17620/g.40375  ORF Transcript_17620/g.40375 Transcript_17620/m.40375 type:complete len:493 (-) Transcript_17620:119-1597(-)